MTLVMTNPHCQLLRQEQIDEFNRLAAQARPELADSNLRGVDLRTAYLKTADLRGAYLRGADLRGVDLSEALLDGASFHEAKISGVLFPADYEAAEIRLSVEYGTRVRSLVSRQRAIVRGMATPART